MTKQWEKFFQERGCLKEAIKAERGECKENSEKISRQSNVDAEVKVVSRYFEIPESKENCSYLMCQDIKSLLDGIGEDIDIYKLGKALKILGFVKSTRRLEKYGMRSVHCYSVFETRMLKFKKAQKEGFEISGVKASDYDSPDEFNEAVHKEKSK